MKHPSLSTARLVVALLALGIVQPARASVVSRLGALYFYDPLLFDAGVLQRGAQVTGGATNKGGELTTALELPFYQDLSLRLAYHQQLHPGTSDGLGFEWRVRAPILERARYGHLGTVQLNYQGRTWLRTPDTKKPTHEVYGSFSNSSTSLSGANTYHIQGGVAVRDQALVPEGLWAGRIGFTLRAAHLFQLYRPPAGVGGKWSMTFSAAELSWTHFGAGGSRLGDGRLDLSPMAPALHFSHRKSTYTLGLMPLVRYDYQPEGDALSWGGMANFSIFYRRYAE